MATLKYFNEDSQQWEYLASGSEGPPGPKGDKGDTGAASMARGLATDLDALYGAANAGSWHYNSDTPGAPSASSGTVVVGAGGSSTGTFQIAMEGTYPTFSRRITAAVAGPWARLDNPYELRGTGSPQGVVAASPGTYYTDTLGSFGAWRWLKKSGTGTTDWEVVHGDTGARQVSTLFLNGWAHLSSYYGAFLSRTDNYVEFQAYVTRANATDGHLMDIPAGFRPKALRAYGSIHRASGTNLNTSSVFALRTEARFEIGYYADIPGTGYFLNIGYVTNDPWPTSLPGTPV